LFLFSRGLFSSEQSPAASKADAQEPPAATELSAVIAALPKTSHETSPVDASPVQATLRGHGEIVRFQLASHPPGVSVKVYFTDSFVIVIVVVLFVECVAHAASAAAAIQFVLGLVPFFFHLGEEVVEVHRYVFRGAFPEDGSFRVQAAIIAIEDVVFGFVTVVEVKVFAVLLEITEGAHAGSGKRVFVGVVAVSHDRF